MIMSYQRKKSAFDKGVAHATLDPLGPGVARVHLIPPKPSLFHDPPSVMIINGQHVIPIGSSWAWLTRIFINTLNKRFDPPREISKAEINVVKLDVLESMKEIYPRMKSEEKILNDLETIVETIINVAKGNPEYNRLGQGMSIRDYANNMKAPHRMDLLVSPMKIQHSWNCNQRCQNCYASKQPEAEVTNVLSTVMWEMIIDKCKDIGIPQLTFTGGEPTMREDLLELIYYARWFITRLNTNGLKITKSLAKDLKNAQLDAVQITLYSHDPLIHDHLVGKKGGFEQTVKGIKNCVEVGLSVSVNTPLIQKNSDYYKTLKFLRKLGVIYTGCSGLIPTGGAINTIDSKEILTNTQMFIVMGQAIEVAIELGMDVMFTSPGWLTGSQLGYLGLSNPSCGACLSNMAISPSGNVIPCQSWLGGQSLGNILRTPWKKIWNNPLCKELRSLPDTNICPLSKL